MLGEKRFKEQITAKNEPTPAQGSAIKKFLAENLHRGGEKPLKRTRQA